jgi:hypothetical protein
MSDNNNNDDFDAEWEAGFNETCDKAKREHDRDSGVYRAEIERLALLPPDLEYQLERKPAAKRLDISVAALDRMVKAKRPKTVKKSAAPEFDPDELQRSAGTIIKCPDILGLFAKEMPARPSTASCCIWSPLVACSTRP